MSCFNSVGRFSAVPHWPVLSVPRGSILAAMGQIFGQSGDRTAARGVLARLEARARERHVPSTYFAVVHLGLGEKETAHWLERAFEQREMTLASLGVNPIYESLRREPRFQELLKRL